MRSGDDSPTQRTNEFDQRQMLFNKVYTIIMTLGNQNRMTLPDFLNEYENLFHESFLTDLRPLSFKTIFDFFAHFPEYIEVKRDQGKIVLKVINYSVTGENAAEEIRDNREKQSRFNVTTKNITPGGSHSVDSHLSSIDREFDRVCRRVSALAPVSANDVIDFKRECFRKSLFGAVYSILLSEGQIEYASFLEKYKSKFHRNFTNDLKTAQFGDINSLVNHFPGCLLLSTLPYDSTLISISGYSEAGASLAQLACMNEESKSSNVVEAAATSQTLISEQKKTAQAEKSNCPVATNQDLSSIGDDPQGFPIHDSKTKASVLLVRFVQQCPNITLPQLRGRFEDVTGEILTTANVEQIFGIKVSSFRQIVESFGCFVLTPLGQTFTVSLGATDDDAESIA